MDISGVYKSKLKSAAEAVGMIRSGNIVVLSSYGGEPASVMSHLHKLSGKVNGVTVWTCNQRTPFPFYSGSACAGSLRIKSIFFGSCDRESMRAGSRIDFYPVNLHSCAEVIVNNGRPDVFISTVPPMDKDGCFQLSPSIQYELECCRAAKTRIFEVNPHAPLLYGPARFHISEIDAVVESDNMISVSPDPVCGDTERMIAENVAELIHDGDTLQIGIGNTPSAIGEALKSKHDLGIHTEMLCTPLGCLMECGAANNSKKTFYNGKAVCGFAWGTKEMYEFIDGRTDIEILPSSYVNDPYVIAKNDNMVAINAALQIDLSGQVCSETIKGVHYSGSGGAADFAEGAYMSKGGRSIFAVSSTAKKGSISRITGRLDLGAAVTIPRNIVDYVVTEYGVARLRGASLRERAQRLIAVAHPDFRKGLEKEARGLLLW